MSDIRTLMKEKNRIEQELQSALSYLDTQPCGRSGPLTDHDGFPREDCDAYAVTQARQNMHILRNDLKVVMQEIYVALQE